MLSVPSRLRPTHPRQRGNRWRRAGHICVIAPLLFVLTTGPADAAKTTPVITDTSRTLWAWLNPASQAQWRGVVNVQESTLSDGRRVLRRTSAMTINIWRRSCDISGCLETVMTLTNAPLTTSTWANDARSARAAITNAAVRVQVYRVTNDALSLVDDVVRLTTVAVAADGGTEEFAQDLTSRAVGLVTVSKIRRRAAQSVVSMGPLQIAADQSTMTVSSNLTTAIATPRR